MLICKVRAYSSVLVCIVSRYCIAILKLNIDENYYNESHPIIKKNQVRSPPIRAANLLCGLSYREPYFDYDITLLCCVELRAL